MNISRIILDGKKYFAEIENTIQIQISETDAQRLIQEFNLIEYNFNRWKRGIN